MDINWKYLGAGFIAGIVVWAAIFLSIPNSTAKVGLVNVSIVDTYSKNTNTSVAEFGGSIHGFNITPNGVYFYTFQVNVDPLAAPENFTSIQTNTTGFKIVGVSPDLPLKVDSGKSQRFTVRIGAPASNFSGKLTIIEYYNARKPKYVNVTQVNFFNRNISTNQTYASSILRGFNVTAGSYYVYPFYINNSSSTISSFYTNTSGFFISNVAPTLPLTLNRTSQLFTVKIATPDYDYSGPITIIQNND